LDQQDPLRSYRKLFHIPKVDGKQAIYFTGNSLGLMPKSASRWVNNELKTWADIAVEGHFNGTHPWMHYHKLSKKALAHLVGGKKEEVIAMNQLTVNLHLMLMSFYQPSEKRYKILMEGGAFPSDQYAIESQIHLRNLLGSHIPPDAVIELRPRDGEYTLRTDDIIKTIESHADELALVLMGAVQYYSGQCFDIPAITRTAHAVGAIVGFDLAHAIGNIPLNLHRDEVDFAVWCGYKYLNSGPGGIAGAFVHERYAHHYGIPRLAGWWGHHESERFKMEKGFKPMKGADGWQLSNFPVLAGAAQLASLEIFEEVGMKALRKKSIMLTRYLEFLFSEIASDDVEIITPVDPEARGCQLSILMNRNGKKVFDAISEAGIIADWREPDVIRVAPVPLYNEFTEVWRFADQFQRFINT
jgi:kynureninase